MVIRRVNTVRASGNNQFQIHLYLNKMGDTDSSLRFASPMRNSMSRLQTAGVYSRFPCRGDQLKLSYGLTRRRPSATPLSGVSPASFEYE